MAENRITGPLGEKPVEQQAREQTGQQEVVEQRGTPHAFGEMLCVIDILVPPDNLIQVSCQVRERETALWPQQSRLFRDTTRSCVA